MDHVQNHRRTARFTKVLVLVLLVAGMAALNPTAMAQYGNPVTESGMKPFGSFDNNAIDSVNLVNFNLNLNIPLGPTYSQLGKMFPINFYLQYEPNLITENYASVDCSNFEDGCNALCGGDDCSINLYMGNSVSGAVNLSSSGGFDWGAVTADGNGVVTSDGGMHEMLAAPSLGGGISVDATGFYDNASGNLMNGNGVSRTGSSPHQYIDTNGNTANITGIAGPFGFSTDTIGRTLLDTDSLNGNFVSLYPDFHQSSSGSGWAMTNNYSGCTGPFTTVYAVTVSLPSINGGTAQYKICYADFAVWETYQFLNDYDDYGNAQYWSQGPDGYEPIPDEQIQSIVLPNNTAYTFYYDGVNYDFSDPSVSVNAASATHALGDLLEITLPTGGSISYTWADTIFPTGTGCGIDVTSTLLSHRSLATRTVDANDGTGPHQWTYSMAAGPGDSQYVNGGNSDFPYLSIVTDPLGNDTVHTFSDVDTADNSCTYYETETQYYQGSHTSGSVLKTINTQYNYTSWQQYSRYEGNVGLRHAINILPHSVTTSYPDGSGLQKTFTYDSGFQLANMDGTLVAGAYGLLGNVMSETDVDLNTGNTLKVITNTYKTDSTDINAGLLRLLESTKVTDGLGNVDSKTVYNYDPSGNGNLTSVNKVVDSSGTQLTWYTVYNSQGMLSSTTDPRNQATNITYDGSGLYPYKVQQPTTSSNVQHVDYYSYDDNTGMLLSNTDENGSGPGDAAHTTTYFYNDPLVRLTTVQYPPTQNGQETVIFGYDDSERTMTTTTPAAPDPMITTSKTFDGLGRLSQVASANGATSETTYNALGQIASVTNPHVGSPSIATTFTYDPLGRMLRETHPDGTYLPRSYSGSTTTATDEDWNSRQLTTDGLGRLTQVVEPGSITTTYTYDGMGNLGSVLQSGSRYRQFNYDMLSRMISASNPETGTVGYTYSVPGSICAGDATLPCSKTDARSIMTSYGYDYLNRIVSKTYSSNAPGGSLSDCYQYDNSTSSSNGNGQLWFEWTPPTGGCPALSTPLSAPPATGSYQSERVYGYYDAMGRVTSEQQCVLGACTSSTPPSPLSACSSISNPVGLQYCYDLAGNLNAYSNGLTSTAFPQQWMLFSQQYDPSGRLSNASCSSGACGQNYRLFIADQANSYTASDALQNWLLGSNIVVSKSYDTRLRPTALTAVAP